MRAGHGAAPVSAVRFSNMIPPHSHGAGGLTGEANVCNLAHLEQNHNLLVIIGPREIRSGSPNSAITSALFTTPLPLHRQRAVSDQRRLFGNSRIHRVLAHIHYRAF